MKSINYSSFLFLVFLVLTACIKPKDEETRMLSWHSEEPLSIPYKTRLQRYEKMNLLRNGSFENGRTYKIDSSKTSFDIDGWQQNGKNIYWVDTTADSLYKADEAFSGSRSVKIVRDHADETDDQGENITSEYIKVIPGNYILSLYLRLQNIKPLRARLGTRIFDAINIRIFYYDKNKILIQPGMYYPQDKQSIDISFKALSFANFRNIKSFGWGKVIGKSNYFPFPEGDIPSSARYVKISIGLIGTGTMWIDSVDYRYSGKNFTVGERMLPYTDSTTITNLVVIPTPKQLSRMESVIYYSPRYTAEELPLIVIPSGAATETRKAAILLRNRILLGIAKELQPGAKAPDIQIITNCNASQVSKAKLIFSIGKSSLYQKAKSSLPLKDIEGHQQGYFVYTTNDAPNVVLLAGNNSIGDYYATLTAIQLFDTKKSLFHNARVTDYPDFENRYFLMENWGDTATMNHDLNVSQNLVMYKLNGAFMLPSDRKNMAVFLSGLAAFRSLFSEKQLFGIIPMVSQSASHDAGSGSIRVLLNAGSRGIIYAPAYQTPFDTMHENTDELSERVNADLILDRLLALQKMVKTYYPTDVFQFCPPLFTNELLDHSIMAGEECNADILHDLNCTTLWSGNSFYSMSTDEADVDRYRSVCGEPPVFMDNSMLAFSAQANYGGCYPYFPGKVRLFNLLEPYGNEGIRDYTTKLDRSWIYFSQPDLSEFSVIRLATAADFAWNTNTYNPDESLWRVLFSRYGSGAATQLIQYADDYSYVLELILRINNNEQVNHNLKSCEATFSEMKQLTDSIARILGKRHRLVLDLKTINNQFDIQLGKIVGNTGVSSKP